MKKDDGDLMAAAAVLYWRRACELLIAIQREREASLAYTDRKNELERARKRYDEARASMLEAMPAAGDVRR